MELIDKYLLEAKKPKKGKKFGSSLQKWYTTRTKDLKMGLQNLEKGIQGSNPQEIATALVFMKDFISTVMIPPIKEIENIDVRD